MKKDFDENGNRIRLDTSHLGKTSPTAVEREKVKKKARTVRAIKEFLCIPCGVYFALTLPLFRAHPNESLHGLLAVLALTFILSTIAEAWRER